VINVDDAFGAGLAREVDGSFSVSRTGEGNDLGVRVQSFTQDRDGLAADLLVHGESIQLRSRLVGLHNLDNLLVALGCLVELGYAPAAAARALGSATAVPGRLERCDTDEDDVLVLVDYAHTPDALERALQAVAGLTERNLVCVFGCGGDRDRGKRPLMGRAAGALASRVIVTSDNPRSEDPARIIADILPGLDGARAQVTVQADRASAIEEAITLAEPGDVVLLAGKGHETYQLVGDRTLDFDDRVEARKALASRRTARGGAR
jgi:UDP-N-acetylmuramoyl-L-alanyl-D-glutamate--2,6-diaminopimelate ligase